MVLRYALRRNVLFDVVYDYRRGLVSVLLLGAFYKIYYYLFKGIAVGCKKLYQLIKGKTAAPSEASVEPPNE